MQKKELSNYESKHQLLHTKIFFSEYNGTRP